MPAKNFIRKAFAQILEPRLLAEGFVGKHPHYQRQTNEHLHLLSIIYDKWGGGFVLEFARFPPGPLETSWGEVIAQEDLEIGYTPPELRARLVQSTQSDDPHQDFFRYDTNNPSKEACLTLVQTAEQQFDQVNDWLEKQVAGPNIATFS